MNKTTKTVGIFTALIAFAILALTSAPASFAAVDNVSTSFTRLGVDAAVMQEQNAELEAARLHQIRSALETDFLAKYRVYIRAIAEGDPFVAVPYPNWALSSTPNDPKANFKYLLDNYLPDLKDQITSMSKLTGVPENNFYEVEYVPPVAGEPLPAPGHVVIKRHNAPAAAQGRLRGLMPSVTLENVGASGVVSVRVNAPSTYLGSEALNASLVRNNGLTLDPVLAEQLASSTVGGPDMTFIPGTIVTFGQKSTNTATAAAQGTDGSVVFPPTIKFKGKDGEIVGVNLMEMEQAAGDPVSRLMFKLAAAPGANAQPNYIRFEDNLGEIIGLRNIYRRDGADGKTGNNLELAIWAQFHTGGDMVILSPGDTVNGETNTRDNVLKFGLGNRARVYLNAAGELRIESDENMRLKAKKIFIEGDFDVSGTSNFVGNVVMRNGLNMSGTNITNVGNIAANSANISGTTTTGTLNATNATISNNPTLAGRTGTSASPYNVWVANAAYASNAGLLGGKAEGSLSVAYAATARSATSATSAGSATTATTATNLSGIGNWTQLKAYIDSASSGASMTPNWAAVTGRTKDITYTASTNGYIAIAELGYGKFYINGRQIYRDGSATNACFVAIAKGDRYLHTGNVSSSEYLWIPVK